MPKLVLQNLAAGAGTVLLHTATDVASDIDLTLPSKSGVIALVGEGGGSGGGEGAIIDGVPIKAYGSPVKYGTHRFATDYQSTTSLERKLTIQNFINTDQQRTEGTRITVRFVNGVENTTSSNIWFNINESGGQEYNKIKFRNSYMTYCPKGSIVDFIYIGDSWSMVDQGLDLYQLTQGVLEIQ